MFNLSQLKFVRTSDKHSGDGEDLLGVGVGRDVAEADRRQTCAGEVQSRDVRSHRVGEICSFSIDRIVELFRQLIQPSYQPFQHADM